MKTGKRDGKRGGSILEVALFLPWYLFLFVGAVDWGFYAHALISVESAARVAVLYTSGNPDDPARASDSAGACAYAYRELWVEPNVSGATVCPATNLPVIITATKRTAAGPDGRDAAEVSITYQTPRLIPIPGLLSGQFTLRRVVQMKL